MRVHQRGRAILRRLSAQDAVRAFRPGDFVLTTSDGGMARLLGWATGGELNRGDYHRSARHRSGGKSYVPGGHTRLSHLFCG